MKKQARSFVLACLFATGCCWAVSARVLAQEEDPRITKIFADWKKRQDAIKVVRYKLEGKSVIPKGAIVDERMKPTGKPEADVEAKVSRMLLLDFSRGRLRFETDEPRYDSDTNKLYPETTIKTFDGKTGKQWRPRELNTHPLTGLKPTTAELGIGTGYMGGTSLGMAWRPLFLGHGSVPCEGLSHITLEAFLVLPDGEYLYVHGEGVRQGRACWVLRTHARKMTTTAFTELWVDKGRDSAVLRHAYLMGGVPREEFDISYVKTTQGWMPEKWTYVARNLLNKGTIQRQETAAVVSMTVDAALEDADFDIEIQPRMLTAEIKYSEPPPGEPPYRGKSNTRLIRIEDDGTRHEVEIVDGVEKKIGTSWFHWTALLLVSAGVLATCWACWRFITRRRKQ